MSWPLPGTDGAAAKRQQGAHTIKVHTLTGRVKGSNVILHVTHGEVLTSAKKRSRCRHNYGKDHTPSTAFRHLPP